MGKHTGKVQAALAFIVISGFFSVMIFVMIGSGATADNGMREARLIMLGALQAAFGGVIGYYFGSSSSSAKKDELLAASTPTPSEPFSVTTTKENTQ